MQKATSDVGRYYDRNTRRFLTLGHGGSALAIHRAVWAPGVTDRQQAMHHVHNLILAELRELAARRVLDLGCGVGGSMRYLLERHPAHYLGATISKTQAEVGERVLSRVNEAGSRTSGEQVGARALEADFTDSSFVAQVGQPVDLAYAVESFIHVPEIESKLSTIAALIRPGGALVVCDDLLRDPRDEAESINPWSARVLRARSRRRRRWLREFRLGWHAHGLISKAAFSAAASAAGLDQVLDIDLTDYLELDRPRDLLTRAFVALTRYSPIRPAWFGNLLGGNALQLCIKNRVIAYRFLLFRRRKAGSGTKPPT